MPVYDDTAGAGPWLDVTEKDKNSRSATFYNTFPRTTATIIRGQQSSGLQSAARNSLMNWTPSLS
ncbi:hypothetical protein ACNKHS_21050 [Shigella flexneri]